jgi:hypothetical protein
VSRRSFDVATRRSPFLHDCSRLAACGVRHEAGDCLGCVTRAERNGCWRFRIDRNEEGEAQGWDTILPPGTEVVRVPHSWNLGKYDDYEGVAWCFRSLELSPAIGGSRFNYISQLLSTKAMPGLTASFWEPR